MKGIIILLALLAGVNSYATSPVIGTDAFRGTCSKYDGQLDMDLDSNTDRSTRISCQPGADIYSAGALVNILTELESACEEYNQGNTITRVYTSKTSGRIKLDCILLY